MSLVTQPRTASRRARPAVLAAAALVAVGALAACEKPNPGVTVWSGTTSAHSEALCWSADGAVGATSCAQSVVEDALKGQRAAVIPVVAGNTLGISVDPVVAENGWIPAIGTQRLVETPITSTYWRFTFPQVTIPADGFALEVIAVGSSQNSSRGLWVFKLTPG